MEGDKEFQKAFLGGNISVSKARYLRHTNSKPHRVGGGAFFVLLAYSISAHVARLMSRTSLFASALVSCFGFIVAPFTHDDEPKTSPKQSLFICPTCVETKHSLTKKILDYKDLNQLGDEMERRKTEVRDVVKEFR